MRLRLSPPVVELEPNQRQVFTAEAEPPPGYWTGVTDGGDIDGLLGLAVDAAGSQTSGFGAHELRSGIGIVEFTIDDQCNPDSSGRFSFTGFITDINGLTYQYKLNLDATAIEVRDEGNNQIYTESYTTVSGDVYRIELSSGFRLFRNGVLKHSRTGLGTTVAYPMTYQASILEPTTAAPTRIPQPRLIGDWHLRPSVIFTAPAHGSITTAGPSRATEYFGGTVPGTYTIIGAIEDAADVFDLQRATATITIKPLELLGPTEITLQPGEKVRFKTNYSDALITWSVVIGLGSFTQGEFTASTTAGISVVRATAAVNGQAVDITVTVPAVITNVSGYIAAKASEQIDFDVNFPVLPLFWAVGIPVESTGDLTVPLPKYLQKDDILLLPAETANQAVSTPSGYGVAADSPQGTGTGGDAAATRLSIFWKRISNPFAEAAPVITDPGDHVVGQLLAFRGCIASGDPWDVTAGDVAASPSTSVSIPGDTTTVPNTLVVQGVSQGTDTTTPQVSDYTNAALANLTERTDLAGTAGNGGGFAIVTGEKAAAGVFGATTATLATSSTQGRISIALKPAVPSWSASAGSINSTSGLWTAPSLAGQTARITVTNGTHTVILEIPVLEVFPFSDFALPVTWDRNLTALTSTSEDRSNRISREKSPPHDSYEIRLVARTLAESNTLDAFFDAHGFGLPFILEDSVRGIRKVGWFDSPIRHEGGDECDIALSFRFLEARL